MGDMRSVGPRGPGPAIRPMTAPVGGRNMHPAPHQMMQHQVATMHVGWRLFLILSVIKNLIT